MEIWKAPHVWPVKMGLREEDRFHTDFSIVERARLQVVVLEPWPSNRYHILLSQVVPGGDLLKCHIDISMEHVPP